MPEPITKTRMTAIGANIRLARHRELWTGLKMLGTVHLHRNPSAEIIRTDMRLKRLQNLDSIHSCQDLSTAITRKSSARYTIEYLKSANAFGRLGLCMSAKLSTIRMAFSTIAAIR